MPNAANAQISIEQGQALVAYEAMTDSGDHQTFNNGEDVWSGKSGFAPTIRPNGIVTGRNIGIIAASGSNDVVDTLAFSAYSQGVLKTVAASTDESITRPATNVAKINSVTMTSAGAIVVIAGTDAADGVFLETRGTAGGAPYIPVDSVELFQVRLTTSTAAPVTASEIFQIVGQHSERSDFPAYPTVNNVGLGQAADTGAEQTAHVKLAAALPLIHTGDTAKKIYNQYYSVTFGEVSRALDFKGAQNSHSVTSTQYYNGTIGSKSSSLGQGGFTALLNDGITDALIADKDEVLTVKFWPNRDNTAFSLTQGTIGVDPSYPVDDQISSACTISADYATAEFSS